MRFQLTVQFVQHDSRLDNAAPAFHIQFQNTVQMLAIVDHNGVVDRLSTLRCAAAPRQHGQTLSPGEVQCGFHVSQCFRNHHRMWHHLID